MEKIRKMINKTTNKENKNQIQIFLKIYLKICNPSKQGKKNNNIKYNVYDIMLGFIYVIL